MIQDTVESRCQEWAWQESRKAGHSETSQEHNSIVKSGIVWIKVQQHVTWLIQARASKYPVPLYPLGVKNQEQHAKHPNQLFLALGDGSTAPFWWGPILCRSLKTLLLSGGFLPTLWLPPPGNHWQYDCSMSQAVFMSANVHETTHWTTQTLHNFPDLPSHSNPKGRLD